MGIVSRSEGYEVLKSLARNYFEEINELVDKGEIEVDDHMIPLEFYLSGDYKVLYLYIYIYIYYISP